LNGVSPHASGSIFSSGRLKPEVEICSFKLGEDDTMAVSRPSKMTSSRYERIKYGYTMTITVHVSDDLQSRGNFVTSTY
jgi:hypothetical protein